MSVDISIIIPLAVSETQQHRLLKDLSDIPTLKGEVIQCCKGNRAISLNKGAAQASGQWLWFLHADSRITTANVQALQQQLTRRPEALHYFKLGFDKNPKQFGLTCLNAWGANVRSRLFGAPFGDQGLCIRRDHFRTLGGYSEIAPYGEDVLLVWKARKTGIKLNRIASTLLTSPRKYQDYGWLKLTLLFQWRYLSLRFKRKQY